MNRQPPCQWLRLWWVRLHATRPAAAPRHRTADLPYVVDVLRLDEQGFGMIELAGVDVEHGEVGECER